MASRNGIRGVVSAFMYPALFRFSIYCLLGTVFYRGNDPKGYMKQDRPSLTAHKVAIMRAAHQVLNNPKVFEDPVAYGIESEGGTTLCKGFDREGENPAEGAGFVIPVMPILLLDFSGKKPRLDTVVLTGYDRYKIQRSCKQFFCDRIIGIWIDPHMSWW